MRAGLVHILLAYQALWQAKLQLGCATDPRPSNRRILLNFQLPPALSHQRHNLAW